jgi:hypothetical protein
MNSKRLKLRGTRFEAARKGASGTMDCSEATIRLDLRPDFCWPQFEVPRKERHNRRRSVGVERGENKILGGSDPALSGFSAAQRHGRRGSLPPNLTSRPPRSVAGRVVGEAVSSSQSHQPEENNIWL